MTAVLLISMVAVLLASAQTQAEKALPQALRYLSEGKLDLAEGEVKRAIAHREDPPDAHNLFGMIAQRQGRLEEAETHFRQAANLNPRSALFQHNLGNALLARRKTGEAIDAFRKALQLDPGHLNSRYMLGRAYAAENRFDLAITELETVRKDNPGDLQAMLYLCDVYFRAGRAPDGLQTARAISRLGAEDSKLQFALASLLTADEQHDEAAATLKKARRDAAVPGRRPPTTSKPIVPSSKVQRGRRRTQKNHKPCCELRRFLLSGPLLPGAGEAGLGHDLVRAGAETQA